MSYRCALALIAGFVALGPVAAVNADAQGAGAAASQPTNAGATVDAGFIRQAADGGLKEVEIGKLAKSRASDSNVKAFADMMVQDHSKANDQLMALAKSKGVTLPSAGARPTTTTAAADRPTGAAGAGESMTASGTSGEQAGGKLATLNGAEFDRAYMTQMVEEHEKTVQLFEQESKSGQDAEVKAWAAKQLPALREHLTQARTVRDRLGASK